MSQNVHTMFVVLSLLRLLLLLLLLLQSNIITLPLLESDWQSCVLRAPCPSNLNPNPKCCSAACQALSLSLFLSDLSQFVSLSASLEGDQDEAGGGICSLAFAFVTHLFWFVYHCDLYFFAFSHSPLPSLPLFHPTVSHFPCSFNLENSEKRAQSNKIKLGFIDPFQFDSLWCRPLNSLFPLLSYCSAHPSAVGLLLCNN